MADKLSKAPLTEVVFEMRWAVARDQAGPRTPLGSDPGYAPAFDALTKHAQDVGLGNVRDFQPAYTGFEASVSRRFYPDDDSPFPLLQIGFGIYAANESGSDYEWVKFKQFAMDGASQVLRNYGRAQHHPLQLTHLELRYLNSFGDEAFGSSGVINFINMATKIDLSFPAEHLPKGTHLSPRGRLSLEADLAKPADARFSIDIVSAQKDGSPHIRLETKVLSQGENVLKSKGSNQKVKQLDAWLEGAHEVTSPAFRSLIDPAILETFR